jgi:predicted MFS family arabinose efflux permease
MSEIEEMVKMPTATADGSYLSTTGKGRIDGEKRCADAPACAINHQSTRERRSAGPGANTVPLPPVFKRLAWSNLAAQSAEQIGLAAAPIFAVLALGADAGEAGLLQTAQTLPFLLVSIPAGVLADRLSRSRLLVATEALRTVSLLIIVGLAALNLLNLSLLAFLGFVGACGTVAYSVTTPALIPSLVTAHDLSRANAKIELARTAAFAAGPALGGALVGWTGATVAFAWACGLSLCAVVLLSGVREPRRATGPRRRLLHEIREGAAFVFNHDLLLPVFLTQFIFNAAFFVLYAAYVPHALNWLRLSASQVGITLGIYGVGMVIGAVCAAHVMRKLKFGLVIATGPVAGLVGSLLLALTIWVPSFTLAGLGFFLLGVGPILWVISTTTLRQTVTPPALLGRVSAINIVAYGARPIGAAIGAVVGGIYNAQVCLIVAALAFALQAAVVLLSRLPRLVEQPAAS